MPESIAYLEEHRDKVRPGEPIDVGMITEYLYVGDADWELPPYTRSGSPDYLAEKLNEYGALGHLAPPAPLRLALDRRAVRPDGPLRRRRRPAAHPLTAPSHRPTAPTEGRTAMPLLTMRHDFRAPDFGPASTAEIYSAALEQFRWADQQGWDFAVVSEHHGLDDGWLPAPITIAAVIAGMTERIPMLLSAVIVPLHDPGAARRAARGARPRQRSGRVWTVAGAGYRPEEFEMCGRRAASAGASSSRSTSSVMLQGVDR